MNSRSMLLVGCLVFTISAFAGTARALVHERQEREHAGHLLASARELLAVVGREVPDIRLANEDEEMVRVRSLSENLTTFWFLSAADCLVCLSTITDLERLGQRHPSLAIVPLIVGQGSPDLDLFLDDMVPYTSLFDPGYSLLDGLGMSHSTPVLLLVARGQVVLVRRGSDPGVSFARQVGQLLDGATYARDSTDPVVVAGQE